MKSRFEWNAKKNRENQKKHGVSFDQAEKAFKDANRIILEDLDHSTPDEVRYFCIGKIEGQIYTVRFTYRNKKIRIFGAGIWRKERKIYEEKNK